MKIISERTVTNINQKLKSKYENVNDVQRYNFNLSNATDITR